MNTHALRRLLQEVRAGKRSLKEAAERLAQLPFEDLGFAKIDHHRALRCGIAEVVFGEGKSVEEIRRIFERATLLSPVVLATRVNGVQASALLKRYPAAHHNPRARTLRLGKAKTRSATGLVAVVTAGTSDLAVAEEALETLQAFGCKAAPCFDVGVAGLHRLLAQLPLLRRARVIIAIAGMEGALPSVLGGLVRCPVIAVPTSTGYGASFGGVAALLAMLNSCAAGVAVVNIDNGFGAAAAAMRIVGE